MNAIVQTGYGSADVMEGMQVTKPAPGPGEVLVRVEAASLAETADCEVDRHAAHPGADIYYLRTPFELPKRAKIGFLDNILAFLA